MSKKLFSFSLIVVAAVLAGCQSAPELDNHAATDASATTPGSGSGSNSNTISGVDLTTSNIPGQGPANVSHTILFDFDSYTIRPDFQSTLQSHADFLRAHRDRSAVLEGHTDERGGREYNLALGQKRAEAVRQALSLLGVSDSQLEAISYGKEKPKVQGDNEEAYAQNRRVEIRYNQPLK